MMLCSEQRTIWDKGEFGLEKDYGSELLFELKGENRLPGFYSKGSHYPRMNSAGIGWMLEDLAFQSICLLSVFLFRRRSCVLSNGLRVSRVASVISTCGQDTSEQPEPSLGHQWQHRLHPLVGWRPARNDLKTIPVSSSVRAVLYLHGVLTLPTKAVQATPCHGRATTLDPPAAWRWLLLLRERKLLFCLRV